MSRKQWMPDRVLACAITAFLGWIASEMLASRLSTGGRWFDAAMTCSLVAGAMGMGINLADRTRPETRKARVERILAGAIIGGLAGAISGSLGNLFSPSLGGTWPIVWGLMGLGIGSVEGLHERSPAKLQIGLVGGLAGGLVGGFLFERVFWLLFPWSNTASRAIAFFVLGLSLGWLIELATVIFCPAWLTVLDGDRPGRRLILSGTTSVLGKAESAALLFQSRGNNTVDQEHARVVRLGNGRFALEDNHSRHGTSVNLVRVLDRVELKDGDLIRIGPNSIRFNERRRKSDESDDSKRSSVKAPAAPRADEAAVAPPSQRGSGSPIEDKKPAATVTKAPQAAAATPPTSTGPVPLGTARCPRCQRLVTGTRPFCVYCKVRL
jgi:pSer/pThr/pTyr-binding forkhead associated (FHA) protein